MAPGQCRCAPHHQACLPCSASLPGCPATPLVSPAAGLGLKAVWVGAEAFGNVVGAAKGSQQRAPQQQQSGDGAVVLSREEAIASIKDDYAKDYFVTGRWAWSAGWAGARRRDWLTRRHMPAWQLSATRLPVGPLARLPACPRASSMYTPNSRLLHTSSRPPT